MADGPTVRLHRPALNRFGVDESFANFFSKFDMLSFYPFREISCEIRYAVHFSPAEISNLAHLGVTGTLYGSEAEAKNEI